MGKSRQRIALEDYDLSGNRQRELRAFCLQYREWLDKKNALYDSIGGGAPRRDSTADRAMKIISLDEKLKLVEQTAIEADAEIYQYILKNVTEDISYIYMDVPCGKQKFYNTVKYFFFLLDKKR